MEREELKEEIRRYFLACGGEGPRATLTGLALFLGMEGRQELDRRAAGPGWEGELLRQAMSRVEEENLQAVYQKETSAGAKFILQRDFGYGDREKPQGAGKILVELTGSPDD